MTISLATFLRANANAVAEPTAPAPITVIFLLDITDTFLLKIYHVMTRLSGQSGQSDPAARHRDRLRCLSRSLHEKDFLSIQPEEIARFVHGLSHFVHIYPIKNSNKFSTVSFDFQPATHEKPANNAEIGLFYPIIALYRTKFLSVSPYSASTHLILCVLFVHVF